MRHLLHDYVVVTDDSRFRCSQCGQYSLYPDDDVNECPVLIRKVQSAPAQNTPIPQCEIDVTAIEARVAAAYDAHPCHDPYADMRAKHEARQAEQLMRNTLERAMFNADELQILEDFKDMTFTVPQLKEIMVRYASPHHLKRLLKVYAGTEPSQQDMNDQESDAFEAQR